MTPGMLRAAVAARRGFPAFARVGATLERLETLGVAVLGYRTSRFPGFFVTDSGFPLDWTVDSPERIAAVLAAQRAHGAHDGAIIVANPLPLDEQLDPALHDRVLHPLRLERTGFGAPDASGHSASLPRHELDQARDVARRLDLDLIEITPGEQADPDYQANRGDRCYFCKTHLYEALRQLAGERGIPDDLLYGWVLCAYGSEPGNTGNLDNLLSSRYGIAGFSVGVLAGAFAGNFLLQIYGARRVGARGHPRDDKIGAAGGDVEGVRPRRPRHRSTTNAASRQAAPATWPKG